MRYTPETLNAKIDAHIGDKYEWSYDVFKGSHTRLKLKCKTDGHEWEAGFNNVIDKGSGCKICRGIYNQRTLTAKLRDTIDDTKFSWKQVGDFNGGETKLEITCKIDGYTWFKYANASIRGLGCPKCAGNLKYTPETMTAKLSEVIGDKFTLELDGSFDGVSTMLYLKCKECSNEFEYTFDQVVHGGCGCASCNELQSKPCGFYIHEGITNDGIRFLKYGITINLKKRFNRHQSSNKLSHYKVLYENVFDKRADARQLERIFDDVVCEKLNKEQFNSYTETMVDVTSEYALSLVDNFLKSRC